MMLEIPNLARSIFHISVMQGRDQSIAHGLAVVENKEAEQVPSTPGDPDLFAVANHNGVFAHDLYLVHGLSVRASKGPEDT
jgi:hypothetical protein